MTRRARAIAEIAARLYAETGTHSRGIDLAIAAAMQIVIAAENADSYDAENHPEPREAGFIYDPQIVSIEGLFAYFRGDLRVPLAVKYGPHVSLPYRAQMDWLNGERAIVLDVTPL